MAIKTTHWKNGRHEGVSRQRGFALLIALIFMSVMLSFGLALSSLAYKQQTLAASSVESQYAFYAADAALECALYADQQNGGQPSLFTYPQANPGVAPIMSCDGNSAVSSSEAWSSTKWIVSSRLSLDAGTHCADVTVYKYKDPQLPNNDTTYIFSQGYDVSCGTVASPGAARFASRGLQASY